MVSLLSHEVHYQLLRIVDSEGEVILKAVSSLLVVRPTTVVSSANLIKLESCLAMQSCVNREYWRGLSTHPCGAPILRISVAEVLLPSFTTWGRPVRKSRTQFYWAGSSPGAPEVIDDLGGHYGVEL
jgi:hypothetical protein